MAFNNADAILWIGMAHWKLWKFHSEAQWSISHNARLIRDQKSILETSKEEFASNQRFEHQGWTK